MLPGGDGGVRPGLVVAKLHGGQEILLGQGHVHLEQIQWRIGIIKILSICCLTLSLSVSSRMLGWGSVAVFGLSLLTPWPRWRYYYLYIYRYLFIDISRYPPTCPPHLLPPAAPWVGREAVAELVGLHVLVDRLRHLRVLGGHHRVLQIFFLRLQYFYTVWSKYLIDFYSVSPLV